MFSGNRLNQITHETDPVALHFEVFPVQNGYNNKRYILYNSNDDLTGHKVHVAKSYSCLASLWRSAGVVHRLLQPYVVWRIDTTFSSQPGRSLAPKECSKGT